MTMDKERNDDPVLDTLFEAGKAEAPVPSADFMARLLTDAEASVPQTEYVSKSVPTPSVFMRFKGLFAASGLSSAAALGLWIGFIAPDVVTAVSPLTDDVASLSVFLPGSDLSVLSE